MARGGAADGFLDECLKGARVRKGPVCGVKIALDQAGDFRPELEQAIAAGDRIPATVLVRVLRERKGIEVSASAMQRHRHGDCRCD